MTGPELSVVVPVYNAERTVGALVDGLAALDIAGGMEVVLVDDGSTDASRLACERAAREVAMPVTVVALSRNFGEHNAVMAGLTYARGRFVVTMDDDLQHPVADVPRLLAAARDAALDVVYAWHGERRHAWWRRAGSAFTTWCSDRLLDKPRGMQLTTFRCLSRFAVDEVLARGGPFPYLDGLILQVTQRADGRSGYTLRRLIDLWLAVCVNFSIAPLRAGAVTGFLVAAAGVIAAALVIGEALTGAPPRGWASLMAAVLLVSGVQLVMIGLVGEYLGRLFLGSNGRPQFVVRDVVRGAARGRVEPVRVSHVARA
jgi:glycosyltransferase involved in cell wall biosynthesis